MGNTPLGAEKLMRTHAAWAQGDIATLNAGISDDIKCRHESAPSLAITGGYAGKAGWNQWLQNLQMTNHFQDIKFVDYSGSKTTAACKVFSNMVNKQTGGVVKGAKSIQSLTLNAQGQFNSIDLVDLDIAEIEKITSQQMCLSRTELAFKEGTFDKALAAMEELVFSDKMAAVDGLMGIISCKVDDTHAVAYGVYESRAACEGGAAMYGEVMKENFGEFLAGKPERSLHKACLIAKKGMTGGGRCVARTTMKVKADKKDDFFKMWATTVDQMLMTSIEAMGYVELTEEAGEGEEAKAGDTFDLEVLAVYPDVASREANEKVVAQKMAEAKDYLAAAPDRQAHADSFVHLGSDGCVVVSEVSFDTKEHAEAWCKIVKGRPDINEVFGDSIFIKAKTGDETGLVYEWRTLTHSRNWAKIDAHNKANMATNQEMKDFFTWLTKMDIKVFGKLSTEGRASMAGWAQDPRITVTYPQVTTALTKYSAIPQRNAFMMAGEVKCKDAEAAALYAKHTKTVASKYKGDGTFLVYPIDDVTFGWFETSNCDIWVNKENPAVAGFEAMGEWLQCIEKMDADLVGDLTPAALSALKQWTAQPWCNVTVNGPQVVKAAVEF